MIVKKEQIYKDLYEDPDNKELIEKYGKGIFEKVTESYYEAVREHLEKVSNVQIEILELGRFNVRRLKLRQKIVKQIARLRYIREKEFKKKDKNMEMNNIKRRLENYLRVRNTLAEIIKYGKSNIKQKHRKK